MSDAQSFSYPSGLSRRNLLQAGSIVLLLGRQHIAHGATIVAVRVWPCLLYTSPSPRDRTRSRMPSSA